MKLNLGCGDEIRENFLNVDMRKHCGVDVVCDMRSLPFRDGSAEEILASDVLEHIPWREVRAVLREWRRVLKNGGRLEIRTPNLEGLMLLYRNRTVGWRREDGEEKGIDPIVERLYGAQDHEGNYHYVIFDPHSLEILLKEEKYYVHLIVPDGEDISNLRGIALKPLRKEEKYSLDRDCPNFEGCPIVEHFMNGVDALELNGEPPIRGCSDDLRFYEDADLMDEDRSGFCPALKACCEKIGRLRVAWEGPIFGPSGYAFAARGSVIGLDDLGVQVSPMPMLGDCNFIVESEVDGDHGRIGITEE